MRRVRNHRPQQGCGWELVHCPDESARLKSQERLSPSGGGQVRSVSRRAPLPSPDLSPSERGLGPTNQITEAGASSASQKWLRAPARVVAAVLRCSRPQGRSAPVLAPPSIWGSSLRFARHSQQREPLFERCGRDPQEARRGFEIAACLRARLLNLSRAELGRARQPQVVH